MKESIDISLYLPHRKPMLMVDTISDLTSEFVQTLFEIKNNNIFVQNDEFAASGLIENAAQTCSAIVAKDYYFDEDGNQSEGEVIGFISAIKTIKIFSLPKIGDVIDCRCTLKSVYTADDYSLCTTGCTTVCNGEKLLEGEINLYITKTQRQSS